MNAGGGEMYSDLVYFCLFALLSLVAVMLILLFA